MIANSILFAISLKELHRKKERRTIADKLDDTMREVLVISVH